ncbi:MAG: hypothetical protein RI932_1325 [Pseudomonadota bacterium]|jgi:hypothetical protein
MAQHVESELDWILDSPVFYGNEAFRRAQSELGDQAVVSLPGSLVAPHNILPLTTRETSALISPGLERKSCAQQIECELQSLRTGRLGLIFEKYLEIILRCRFGSPNILCRLPVREHTTSQPGSKTWGEFDFLFLNAEMNRIEHWESSVKFYLQVQDDPRWRFCWGPGVQDRLDLKGSKTFLQQIALSSTALGIEAIPKDWRQLPLVKRVFAKGTIFYRWHPREESFSQRMEKIIRPYALSADHLKSWWIHMDEVEALREHYPGSLPALLPRRYWMTGLYEPTLSESLEPWPEFIHKLSTRAAQASDRKECLHVGLYSDAHPRHLLTTGFIATPHFLDAQEKGMELAHLPFQ